MSAVNRLNLEEQVRAYDAGKSSWHDDYKDTNWVYVGGLNVELSEGDVICVFSQYGEIEDLHLLRDEDTGKSKGFAFLKYQDWRSTVLAVDNFNGVELVGKTLRVDHSRYERPKKKKDLEQAMTLEEKIEASRPGHAYQNKQLEGDFSLHQGYDVFKPSSSSSLKESKKVKKKRKTNEEDAKKKGKHKKAKKKHKKKQEDKLAPPPKLMKTTEETAEERRKRIAALSNKPAQTNWKG